LRGGLVKVTKSD